MDFFQRAIWPEEVQCSFNPLTRPQVNQRSQNIIPRRDSWFLRGVPLALSLNIVILRGAVPISLNRSGFLMARLPTWKLGLAHERAIYLSGDVVHPKAEAT